MFLIDVGFQTRFSCSFQQLSSHFTVRQFHWLLQCRLTAPRGTASVAKRNKKNIRPSMAKDCGRDWTFFFLRSHDILLNLCAELEKSSNSSVFWLFDSFAAAIYESSFSCTADYRFSNLAARSSTEWEGTRRSCLKNQRQDLGWGRWLVWGHTGVTHRQIISFPQVSFRCEGWHD